MSCRIELSISGSKTFPPMHPQPPDPGTMIITAIEAIASSRGRCVDNVNNGAKRTLRTKSPQIVRLRPPMCYTYFCRQHNANPLNTVVHLQLLSTCCSTLLPFCRNSIVKFRLMFDLYVHHRPNLHRLATIHNVTDK